MNKPPLRVRLSYFVSSNADPLQYEKELSALKDYLSLQISLISREVDQYQVLAKEQKYDKERKLVSFKSDVEFDLDFAFVEWQAHQ